MARVVALAGKNALGHRGASRAEGVAIPPMPAQSDGPDAVAIRALGAAASELSVDSLWQLIVQLHEQFVLRDQRNRWDLHPLAHGNERHVNALKSVAETLGRMPSTSEYVSEYRRRRDLGDASLPSVAAVLRRFGSWAAALAAAGHGSPARVPAFEQRKRYRRRVVERYSDERVVECLRVCTEDLGRIPMVRDYAAWREGRVAGRPGQRPGVIDIPHYRTVIERFGGWSNALRKAGLPWKLSDRSRVSDYTELR